MRPHLPQALTVRLDVSAEKAGEATSPAIACRSCRNPLEIHQPDAERPADLLGTCSGCGEWYYLAPDGDEDRLIVVRLPLAAILRDALSAPRGRRRADGPGASAGEPAG